MHIFRKKNKNWAEEKKYCNWFTNRANTACLVVSKHETPSSWLRVAVGTCVRLVSGSFQKGCLGSRPFTFSSSCSLFPSPLANAADWASAACVKRKRRSLLAHLGGLLTCSFLMTRRLLPASLSVAPLTSTAMCFCLARSLCLVCQW